MRPKGKLFALIALFAAVGLITATGAFTTVEAERTATVDVAGDSGAMLQIQSMSGVAVEDDGTGVLSINLDDPGLNPNARTEFAPILNVTNQGTNNDIELGVTITTADDGEIDAGSIIVETSDEIDLTSESVSTATGQPVNINLIFDLTDENGNQVNELGDSEDITITFDATESE